MAIQHTQGKWMIHKNFEGLRMTQIRVNDNLIASVHSEIEDYESEEHCKEAEANTQLIVDAVNNTAGAGIDPNAVVGLLEAVKELHVVADTIYGFDEIKRIIDIPGYGGKTLGTALDKAFEAIKSAELK